MFYGNLILLIQVNNCEIIFRIDCRCSLCLVNCRNVYELQKHVLSWRDGLTFNFKFVWTNIGKSSEYIRTSDCVTFNLIFIDISPINAFALDYRNKLKQRIDFLNGKSNDNNYNDNDIRKQKQTENSMYHGCCNISSNIDLNDNLNLMAKKQLHFIVSLNQCNLIYYHYLINSNNNSNGNYKFYDFVELQSLTIKFDTQIFMKQLQMLYRSKWHYHKQICMTLSKDRFRHCNVRAITNEEKLLICEVYYIHE